MAKSAQVIFTEREKRVNDAIACRVPDRVPLLPLFGGFSSSYAGISRAEELYDPVKCFDAVLKTTIDFEPDMAGPTLSFGQAITLRMIWDTSLWMGSI